MLDFVVQSSVLFQKRTGQQYRYEKNIVRFRRVVNLLKGKGFHLGTHKI